MRHVHLLFLAGCSLSSGLKPYYGNRWDPPEVASLSSGSEVGNVGGGTIEIRGSGFGDTAADLVVLFGDHNAEILAVSDSVIEVRVPNGPITGGAVAVTVATGTGFASAPEGYVYDVGELYENESGFVQVNNFWESCYGGLSSRLDDEYEDLTDLQCDLISYIGMVGIDGRAEQYDFAYPRVHTELIGFFGGTDQGNAGWTVERPGAITFAFGIEDRHEDIGPVTLHNPFWDDEEVCVDLDATAGYRYGGGDPEFPYPTTVVASGIPVMDRGCDEDGSVVYNSSDLNFCTSDDADGVPTYVYEADWPVVRNFFADADDELDPVEISLDAPEVGIEGQQLNLPENVIVYNLQGYSPITEDYENAGDLWSLVFMETCFDDDGNGDDPSDVAMEFTWEPSRVEYSSGGAIVGHQTYVRLTLTSLALNWFGTTGYPARATIVVPDENDVDLDGFSHLSVPMDIMFQLPSVRTPESGGGQSGLTPSSDGDWGYLITTFERVTDYALATANGDQIVFSYATGDFGFAGWANPAEGDGCHNCQDDDEDGWIDARDPDCADEATTELGFGTDICNDGEDNDDDGQIDADDEFCDAAADDDETNCDDRVDNDADGLRDMADPECVAGENELNNDSSCGNGLDDDEDGWIDDRDPDCADGDPGDAESGFGETECNDGQDNDLDETIDADDPDCAGPGDVES